MAKRYRGRNRSSMPASPFGSPRNGNQTLSDRALNTGLLYNYLDYVSPADVDGIKRANIKVNDNSIDATPIPVNKSLTAQMYGRPTIIAKEKEPMALISKFSPKDPLFPLLEEHGTSLLRSALRKIVDEV